MYKTKLLFGNGISAFIIVEEDNLETDPSYTYVYEGFTVNVYHPVQKYDKQNIQSEFKNYINTYHKKEEK